jgi:membrane protease YdiL (CAAX protease family)
MMKTNHSIVKRYPLVFFFALAFLFTWAYWLPQAAADRGLLDIQVPGFVALIAGYGPALAAILIAGLAQGRQGLRQLFASLARWRVGLRWYLAALLIPPAIQFGALGLHLILSGEPLRTTGTAQLPFGPEGLPLWGQGLMLFVIFVLGFDGLGEELGWRGYALPRLQDRRSALVSSLILGFFWALWHLPYRLSAGSALEDIPFLLFLLNLLAQSILYTWLYNNTRGSTLLAILFHAAGNTTSTLLGAVVPAAGDPRVYAFGAGLTWLLAILLLLRGQGFDRTESIAGRTRLGDGV